MSTIQRPDKLYKKFKHSRLETDKDNFKAAKMHLQKMTLKKKKSYSKELAKNRNKLKELWKTFIVICDENDRKSKLKTEICTSENELPVKMLCVRN